MKSRVRTLSPSGPTQDEERESKKENSGADRHAKKDGRQIIIDSYVAFEEVTALF